MNKESIQPIEMLGDFKQALVCTHCNTIVEFAKHNGKPVYRCSNENCKTRKD